MVVLIFKCEAFLVGGVLRIVVISKRMYKFLSRTAEEQ